MRLPVQIVLLSLLLCVRLAAQDCPYAAYFNHTGLATADYTAGHYASAAREFKSAFAKTSFPLGKDLALALRTAEQTQDTLWAAELCVRLARGGVPLDWFEPYRGYAWYPEFAADFPQHQAYFNAQFDHAMRERLLALRTQDSLFNERYHLWRTGAIELSLDELIAGATAVRDSFRLLVQAHGFPCEQKMGYFCRDGAIQSFPVVVLLIHLFQLGDMTYKDKLPLIVCDGKLRPVDQAMLNRVQGFGDGSGIEQEMRIRYEKYRGRRG